MKRLSLPVMQCDPGCTHCCTVVVCRPEEYDEVLAYAAANGIEPLNQDLQCPWFQDGKCSVYPVRPFVCQLYGHTEALTCPRGYNANIDKKEESKLAKRHAPNMPSSSGFKFLHEVLPGWAERFAVRG